MDKPILQARAVFIYIALAYILITILVESIPLGLKNSLFTIYCRMETQHENALHRVTQNFKTP